jgi:hypothetical protein
MTYTWTIGGTNYTTTTNSYTTASLTASATYTVKVKNTNNCESNTANGNITVNYPGTNGQSSSPCGCATGTTICNTLCLTDCNTCAGCLTLATASYPYAWWTSGGCITSKERCVNGTVLNEISWLWNGTTWDYHETNTGCCHNGCTNGSWNMCN